MTGRPAKISLTAVANAEVIAARDSSTFNPGTVDVVVYPPIPIDDWTHDNLPERIAEVRQLYLDTLKDWFMANTVEAVNYVCVYPTATVKDIWKALAVQEAFQEVLDNPEAEQALQHPALKSLLEQAAT